MRIHFYYRWVEFDIDKFNHHKLVGWKRLHFKKKEYDGYDEYILDGSFDFDWGHTESVVNISLGILRSIYDCIKFINDYDFSIVQNFSNAFRDAENYILRLRQAFVQGGYLSYPEPDLVFVSKIASNNGLNSCSIDGRDILKITIEGMKVPTQDNKIKPKLYENSFICPICKSKVYKNYDGCCNCKQLVDWEGIE